MRRSLITEKPDGIRRAADEAIRARTDALETVYTVPAASRTFMNTVEAIEDAATACAEVGQTAHVLFMTHPDRLVRDAAKEAGDRIDEAVVRMDADRRQWNAAQEWLTTGEQERLDGPRHKLAEDRARDLKRRGFALPDDRFNALTDLRVRLKQLETEFEAGINDYRDGIWVSRDALAGLPERYVSQLKRNERGEYHIGLEYPELFPFMQMSASDEARERLGHLQLRKGGAVSLERLVRMIMLRQRIAGMLGYPDHVAYQTEPRMVSDPQAVRSFIRDLLTRLAPLVERELADLKAFKQRRTGKAPGASLGFHEVAYWTHQLQQERYGYDTEELRQYFPLDGVIRGTFELFGRAFGVAFEPAPEVPVWHADCRAFAVIDREDRTVFGHVIMDLHPREGKYGHAMTAEMRLSRVRDGRRVPGLVALICNFTPPTADAPSLLDHDELETFLHEFGHVMHTLLSSAPYASQNGFACPMDFVEAPSQMAEYWAWHPDSLRLLSGHWRTGEPIPESLAGRLISSRHHLQGIYYANVALKSLYDLEMHSGGPDAPVDAATLARRHIELARQYTHIELPDDAIMAAGWDHMADYDAGYYSYPLSRVTAVDLFSPFVQNGVLSDIVGRRFRDSVLGPGASRPESVSVTEFLQRPSSQDAFYRDLGI